MYKLIPVSMVLPDEKASFWRNRGYAQAALNCFNEGSWEWDFVVLSLHKVEKESEWAIVKRDS
jgi:hypothetical protein